MRRIEVPGMVPAAVGMWARRRPATYEHWPGKTVTAYDDHVFCLLTMNRPIRPGVQRGGWRG